MQYPSYKDIKCHQCIILIKKILVSQKNRKVKKYNKNSRPPEKKGYVNKRKSLALPYEYRIIKYCVSYKYNLAL